MRNFQRGLLAAVAITAALFLSGCDSGPSDVSVSMPERLDERVVLRAGENLRITRYQPGTNVRLDSQVDFREGETGEVTYHTEGPGAGRLKSARIFYKSVDGSEHGAIKRELELDIDGRTFIKDYSYFPDGTLQRQADRRGEHSFESTDFYSGDRIIAMHRMFMRDPKDYSNPGWRISREETYRNDGSPIKKFLMKADKSSVTDEYNAGKVLISHTEMNPGQSQRTVVVYADVGKTVVKTIEQNDVTKITLYKGSRVARELEFNWEFSHFNETVYDANGLIKMKRLWWIKPGATPEQKAGKITADDFYIGLVNLFDESGEVSGSYYWDDKHRLRMFEERSPDGDLVTKNFITEEGLLKGYEKLNVKDRSGDVKEYDQPIEVDLPVISPEWLELEPFDQPPATLPNAQPYGGP